MFFFFFFFFFFFEIFFFFVCVEKSMRVVLSLIFVLSAGVVYKTKIAAARNSGSTRVAYKTGGQTPENHTFSAFWLRSSVVSVLISLISGTWRMASQEFKCIVYAVAWV